jgi:hypothetical protein
LLIGLGAVPVSACGSRPVGLDLRFHDAHSGAAIEGLGVAVDVASGGREESTTDGAGTVRFGVDVADVTGVVAHAPGYRFEALSGDRLREEVRPSSDGTPTLDWVVAGAPPSSFVTVSGLALHMESADHGLSVTATSPDSTYYQVFRTSPPQEWSIQVPGGMPFKLIGFEWVQGVMLPGGSRRGVVGWTVTESDALHGDATIDLDFAHRTTPVRAFGAMALPDDADLAAHGHGYLTVETENLAGLLGPAATIELAPDGASYEYDARWIELPDEVPRTRYTVTAPGGVTEVEAALPGPPSSGHVDPRWLSPVTITEPTADLRQGPHDAITWRLPVSGSEGARQNHVRFETPDGEYLGGMSLARDETEATLPALPATSEEDDVFWWPLVASVERWDCAEQYTRAAADRAASDCDRVARARTALLVP